MQRRRRRGHKGAGRQAKVLPAQVAAGAAPASGRCCRRRLRQARLPQNRPPIFSNPLVPKSNGAAEGARRGRGAECRGRNHFRGSVHTCRDESLTTETVAACASSLGDAKSCTRVHAPDSHTRHVHERGGRESGRGREREPASVPVPLSSCEREEGARAGSRGPRSNVVGGGRARPQHTSTLWRAALSLLRHLSPICCTFAGEPRPRSTVRRPPSAAQLPRRGGRPVRGGTRCV